MPVIGNHTSNISSMATTEIQKSTKRNLPIGSISFWEPKENGIKGTTTCAQFEITVFSEDTIRIQVGRDNTFSPNPYSVVSSPKAVEYSVTNFDNEIWIKTTKIHLQINVDPFSLTFCKTDGSIINEDDTAFAVSWLGTEVTNYKRVQKDERFIGLGEKTGGLNRSGNAYVNWNTDYFAYGVGDDPLYMSIPFYLGIHGKTAYGIFFDNTHKTTFNFGASTNRFIYYSADDGDLDYYFFHDDSIGRIITAYTDLTGRMEMPPMWALGFQQCRYSYYPASEVLTLANTFRDKNMPADVIYLDIHHMEKYKVFTFDGEKFPDPKSMIEALKKKGFRVVVIMDPGIKTQKGYLPYEEGRDKDLFVKYPDGEIYEAQVWPGWCAFPDFTKAETREWWGEQMGFYEQAGVDGYWTDMNEPASWGQFTPNLIEFEYEGEQVSHRKARNIYGFQMAKSAQMGSIKQRPEERPFVLTRSGFAGIQRYAAAWTGDNVASEEHMMAGVRLVNSLGLSGVSFSGYDVGGFAGEASKSLFARWMSIAAFSPFYRAHSMINSNDAEPWAFGEEVEEISRNYMNLRYKLLPTIYSNFYKSTQDGLPLAKSLAIDFPFDPLVYDSAYHNQYLFCEDLLIAPVESTKEITKVYLPEGNWYYLYDGTFHSGNQVIFQECPLSYLPVYVKAGSILAMQSLVSHSNEAHDGILHLHVFMGEDEFSFQLYEDDGIGFGYQNGEFRTQTISVDGEKKTIKFSRADGLFPSKFKKVKLFFHGFSVNEVTWNGNLTPVREESVAFLNRLTEFDPLPEHSHPYFEMAEVPSITIDLLEEAFQLKFN